MKGIIWGYGHGWVCCPPSASTYEAFNALMTEPALSRRYNSYAPPPLCGPCIIRCRAKSPNWGICLLGTGRHGITESGEFDYSTHIDLGWLMIKIVNGHKSDHQKGLLGIADYLVFSSWRHWLWRSLEGSARNATSNSLPTRYFDQVNKNTSENECPSQKQIHLKTYH